MITQEYLKSILNYDESTGKFIWLVAKSKVIKIGMLAGTDNGQGYIVIRIDGNGYRAHRLAWMYVNRVWPLEQIDHINGIKNDNRIDNLRCVNNSQNQMNRKVHLSTKSGFKGVSWHRINKSWQATCRLNKKQYHLGYFKSKELAINAYKEYAKKLHGEFYCD